MKQAPGHRRGRQRLPVFQRRGDRRPDPGPNVKVRSLDIQPVESYCARHGEPNKGAMSARERLADGSLLGRVVADQGDAVHKGQQPQGVPIQRDERAAIGRRAGSSGRDACGLDARSDGEARYEPIVR
jgi:hypothetical protein